MSRLGDDQDGTWFFAPRGAGASYAADGPKPLPVSFLTLVPRGDQWWIATWMRDNDEIDIDLYIDIVHPPIWISDGCLQIIDLDLDVVRLRTGEVLLDDEDEFERHQADLGYPADVVRSARAVATQTFSSAQSGAPPLAEPPDNWLAAARSGHTEPR